MSVKFNSLVILLFTFSTLMSSFTIAKPSGEILYQQCSVCHGVKGEGNDALNSPVLAGQEARYIIRQIQHYAKDTRAKSALAQPMVLVAKTIDLATDLPMLAAYIAKLPIPSVNNHLLGDIKNGSRYYQAKCGACHGSEAQGNAIFKAPRLANQSTTYIQQQMKDFVDGKRGYAKEDKLGRQMAMMAKTTKGKVLIDILYYISVQEAK